MLYWSAAAAVAVLFDYSATMAITPAASASERPTHHRNTINSAANACKPLKLRLTQLGGWPDITEPLPPKAKWKHHQRYHRLRNQVQELEAQAKQTRFRKQIDIRTFAYHVS